MNDKTIHNSSDPVWNQMIADLSDCADTVQDQDFVQAVKASGELTVDNVVDFFDSNLDGRLNEYDSNAWFHRSFLTQYVDIAFEDRLIKQYHDVMKTGIAVDKLKLLDKIRALPMDEEIALLDKVITLTEDYIVVKKAFFRLQDLDAHEVLQKEKWQKFSKEHENDKIKYFWAYKVEGDEQNIEALVNNARTALNSDVSFKVKKTALNRLLSYSHASIEALCIEVIHGDFDIDLQVDALKYLSAQSTQTSFEVLKSELLREDDAMYHLIKSIGIDPDNWAVGVRRDKQHPDYRHAVNEAFSSHRFFDATKEVRCLLEAGFKNFSYFDMRGADLSGLDFNDCDMMYANLAGADLTHTNLGGAINANNIFASRVKLGDGVWLGDLIDLRQAITEEGGYSECASSFRDREKNNLYLFQQHTHYFNREQVLSMLLSNCTNAHDVALAVTADDELTPDFIPALIGQALRNDALEECTVNNTERLKVIQTHYEESLLEYLGPVLDRTTMSSYKHVVYMIGELCGAEVVDVLLGQITKDHQYIDTAVECAKALIKIQSRCGCVPEDQIIAMLDASENNWHQKYVAVIYLGEVKSKEASTKLWSMLLNKNELVSEDNIVNALIRIQNEHGCITNQMIISALQNEKHYVVEEILGFLKEVVISEEVVPHVIAVMRNDNVMFNWAGRHAIDVLIKYVEQGGELPFEQLMAAVDARGIFMMPLLGAMGNPEAVPYLLDQLENAQASNQSQAYATALIEIHQKTGAVPLDKIREISINASHVCARNGAREVLDGIAQSSNL